MNWQVMGQESEVVILMSSNVEHRRRHVQVGPWSWSSTCNVGELIHLEPAVFAIAAKRYRVHDEARVHGCPCEDSPRALL